MRISDWSSDVCSSDLPILTTIPGYHLAVAALLKVASIESVAAMRAVGAGIGVACALVFWLIRRRLGDPHASRSAALLFFLPFLFPSYFLVYTVVLSLLLVLFALLATLERRPVIADLAVAMSTGVRQDTGVGSGFISSLGWWRPLPN